MKKKPILITAFSVLLCLSLVLTAVFHNPVTAFAVSVQNGDYTFETDDAIRVLGWYGEWNDCPNGQEDYWNATKLTYNGRKWKTDDYMRWQNTEDKHHFLAVYPYNLVTETTDLTAVPFDGSEQTDVLFGRWSGTKPGNNTVDLEMDHLLSRFDLHLTFNEQYTTVSDITVTAEVITDCTVDLLADTPVFALGETKGNVQFTDQPAADGMAWSGSSLIIPQNMQNAKITIRFTADGEQKELTYMHADTMQLNTGERTTLTLLVGEEIVKISGVAVTPWEEVPPIDGGEAEEIIN